MIRAPLALVALAVLAQAGVPLKAHAETVNCTPITSLPATLATQGVYCLNQDLATALATGNAITVAVNNVTIDCNGFKLGGLGAGPTTQAVGILAEARYNVIVRNCNVRGFSHGIVLNGSGHVVEGNRLDGNTRIGITVGGDGSVVRDNRVLASGGTPVLEPSGAGIFTSGSVDIAGNTVAGVSSVAGGNGNAIGIYTYQNLGGAIDGNRVRGVAADGSGDTIGILILASDRLSVRENQVVGNGAGTGIDCDTDTSAVSGNHVLNFAVATTACRDGGGNFTD